MGRSLILFALLQFFATIVLGDYQLRPIIINPGQKVVGQVDAQVNKTFGTLPNLYRIWIDEDVSSVTYSLQATTGGCSSLTFTVRTDGHPCYAGNIPTSQYLCNGYLLLGTDSSSDSVPTVKTLTSSQSFSAANDYRWVSGGYLYLSVWRTSDTEYSKSCPFTLFVNTTTGCSQGQVSVGGATSFCQTYNEISLPRSSASSGSDQYTLYKFNVDLNTAYLNFSLSTSPQVNTLNIFGSNYFASSNATASDCSLTSGTKGVYNLICSAPRAGTFFVLIVNSARTPVSGSLNVEANLCLDGYGPECMDGHNSLWESLDAIATTKSVSIGQGLRAGGWFEVPENYGDVVAIHASTNNPILIIVRRNGFATENIYEGGGSATTSVSSADGTANSVKPSSWDFLAGGRFYYTFWCNNQYTGGCQVSFYAEVNSQFGVIIPTTRALTSAAITTGEISTGALTSASTTADITSAEITTKDLTSGTPFTTGAITTRELPRGTTTVRGGTTGFKYIYLTVSSGQIVSPYFVLLVLVLVALM